MELYSKYTNDVFLKLMMMDEQNKVCFDCNMRKSTFGTLPLAVFICDDCALALYTRRLVPYIDSLSIDWHKDTLAKMIHGGNRRALAFFKEHGWVEDEKLDIHAKHTSILLANSYQNILEKEIRGNKSFYAFRYRDNDPIIEKFIKEDCQEIYLARKKFPSAKSISSAEYSMDPLIMNDTKAKLSLANLSGSSAISSNDLFGCSANTCDFNGSWKAAVWRIFDSVGGS